MNAKAVTIIGFILSLVVIFFLANRIEQGDSNAVSMYYVVFLIPVLILVSLNGLYIRMLTKLTNKTIKALLAMIPIAILSILSLDNSLMISTIDGSVSFIAQVGAIALGLTNVLWIVSTFKPTVLKIIK